MKHNFALNATAREAKGRSASRCLRRQEKVPGILYGANKQPQSLAFDHNEMIHALEHEAFYSSIIELKMESGTEKAVLKDLQRHAYKPKLMHVDFLRIDENKEIHLNIPLHFVGECPGVKAGGVINHLLTDIEVICLPKDLPEFIEVDLSTLELDQTLHLSDLKIPAQVKLAELLHDNDAGVVNVHVPRASKADLEAAAAEAAAAAAASASAAPVGAAAPGATATPAPAAEAAPAAKKEEKK